MVHPPPSEVEARSRGAVVRALPGLPRDEDLVARAAGGDAWALETLYRRHVGGVMQAALRILRNRSEAEDVVQDSFMIAFSRLGQLREPAAFGGWLRRIAISNVHRRLRRRRVEPIEGLEAEAASGASPMVRAELRLLDEVLNEIHERDRVPWILRYVLGYKLEEVADASGCSLATAKRRIRSAHAIVSRHVSLGEAR